MNLILNNTIEIAHLNYGCTDGQIYREIKILGQHMNAIGCYHSLCLD